MKRIIFILIAVIFASCEKKQDYVCTEIFNNGYTTPTIKYTTHSNWTLEDANHYEIRSQSTFNNGKGYTKASCNPVH